jgi:hypothetical protein
VIDDCKLCNGLQTTTWLSDAYSVSNWYPGDVTDTSRVPVRTLKTL